MPFRERRAAGWKGLVVLRAKDPGCPALRAADHPHCWQETIRSTKDGGRGIGRDEA